MKTLVIVLATVFSMNAFGSNLNEAYPTSPDQRLTPGSLCNHADQIRYPEKIAYCERDVETGLKRRIIRDYDQKLGFQIQSMNRQHFKIDHFIPLCAGGSNNPNNLWPQHKSVYELTDPLEQIVCEKMAQGRLRQNQAVELIRDAKLDLSKVDDVLDYVESL